MNTQLTQAFLADIAIEWGTEPGTWEVEEGQAARRFSGVYTLNEVAAILVDMRNVQAALAKRARKAMRPRAFRSIYKEQAYATLEARIRGRDEYDIVAIADRVAYEMSRGYGLSYSAVATYLETRYAQENG